MNSHKIMIHDQCIGCGLCVSDCPAHNIRLNEKRAEIIAQDCIMCGHCEAICPKNAVFISGYEETAVKKEKRLRLDPKEVLEVIRFRRTIRQFQDKEIPESVMKQILEAGRLTHTSKNAQDLSILVLDQQKAEAEALAVKAFRRIKPFVNLVSPLARRVEISDNFFFFKANKVLVISAEDEINAVLAASNMELVAEANGLGALYSGYFVTAMKLLANLRKFLGIPHGEKPAVVLVLGYPKINYQRAPKREKLDVKYL